MKWTISFSSAIIPGHPAGDRLINLMNRRSLKILTVFSILMLALSFFN